MLLVGKQDDFALPLPLAAGHEQVCGAVGGPVQCGCQMQTKHEDLHRARGAF